VSESFSLTLSAGTAAPENSAITELVFDSYGTNNTEVDADSLAFGSGPTATDGLTTIAGTITFADGAGVFQGVASGAWAPSPTDQNTVNDVPYDYLAAVENSSLTIDFKSPQEYFGLLWGSISSGNTLQFFNGSTLVASITYNGTALVATVTAGDQVTTYDATAQDNYYVSINIPTGYTSVVASSSSGGFEFAEVSYAATTISDPFDGPGTTASAIPYDPTINTYLCFLEGTMIATPGGGIAVETLQPGTPVVTQDGTTETVRWVGVRAVSTKFADPLRANPIRIAAGALEDGVPARDLLLSPDHALLVDGVLIQAAALLNGSSVRRDADMPERFTYYHVELASHALVLAENTPAETFVDNADRGHFDNWDSHPDHGAIVEMDLPRAKSARQIPAATRARLEARARAILGARDSAAA
jgi:hypothetical protein